MIREVMLLPRENNFGIGLFEGVEIGEGFAKLRVYAEGGGFYGGGLIFFYDGMQDAVEGCAGFGNLINQQYFFIAQIDFRKIGNHELALLVLVIRMRGDGEDAIGERKFFGEKIKGDEAAGSDADDVIRRKTAFADFFRNGARHVLDFIPGNFFHRIDR